jgi:hypothetical protein
MADTPNKHFFIWGTPPLEQSKGEAPSNEFMSDFQEYPSLQKLEDNNDLARKVRSRVFSVD